jgi:hypothetical protein
MAGLLASTGVVAGAPSREVRLQGFETRFAPGELGGVIRILRYAVAQPDRSETDYVLLSQGAAGSAPQAVQIVGTGGELIRLADVEGSDCTLDKVRISSLPGGGAQIIYAERVFSGDLRRDVNSDPAPMRISVLRAESGRNPGDSDVVFRLAGQARQSRPVCRLKDVQSEMIRLSAPQGTGR